LRSGPSLRPRLDVRAGGVWPLRASRIRSRLPADRPIPGIVTGRLAASTRLGRVRADVLRYPRALRGSQQTAADQPAVSRLALLSKSGALPIELTTQGRIMAEVRPTRVRTCVRAESSGPRAAYTAPQAGGPTPCHGQHGAGPLLPATWTGCLPPLPRRQARPSLAVQTMRRRSGHSAPSEDQADPCGGVGWLLRGVRLRPLCREPSLPSCGAG
jgi:hypothetical protein